MASINFTGLQQEIKKFAVAEQNVGPALERAVKAGAKVLAASRTVSPASSTIWADTDRRDPDPVTTPSTQKHRPWWMAVLSSGRG